MMKASTTATWIVIGLVGILVGILSDIAHPSLIDWPSARKSPKEVMTALVYERHGQSTDVLQWRHDIPRPIPRDDQVLIHVKASSINPVDFKYRRNQVPDMILPKPKIPGLDVAGIIVARGANVDEGYREGDRVVALLPFLGSSWGAAAEFVAVKTTHLCKLSQDGGIEFVQAAAVPLAALTAVQKLQKIPSPTAGKKILIHAGAGGVGTFAIQYAKHVLGMYVATTASAPKAALLQSLGADLVIDYTLRDFTEDIQNYDAVLDPMSFTYEARSLSKTVLKPDGIYLNVVSSDWALVNGKEKSIDLQSLKRFIIHNLAQWFRPGSMPRYDLTVVRHDGEVLKYIMNLIEEGTIRPVIDSVYNWTDAVEAYRKLETGRATGKIVLRHGI